MGYTFGEFLKQKRQEKSLTQKQLSKLLIVSESAISKWEKDVAHPDITLLPRLAEILGVTEHELITASIDKQTREESRQAKKWRAFSMTWSLFFYITYGIALITCFICNLAIDGTLSWFWIVVSALLLAFTFTNLPKILQNHKLILLPLSMYLALCLLLRVCCIYTKGDWFWISAIAVLLGLIIIFTPICISKYKVFEKIHKFNDFVSIGVDFILLNILLIIVDNYTFAHNTPHWYLNLALPIVCICYGIINLFLCIRFLRVNKLLKTSIILFMINILYLSTSQVKVNDVYVQEEIDALKIYKANFSNWTGEIQLEQNIHCIIFLTIITLATIFLITGLIKECKKKNKNA